MKIEVGKKYLNLSGFPDNITAELVQVKFPLPHDGFWSVVNANCETKQTTTERLVDIPDDLAQVKEVLHTFEKEKYNACNMAEQQITGWYAAQSGQGIDVLLSSMGMDKAEWNWLKENEEVDWMPQALRSQIDHYFRRIGVDL